MVLPDPARTPFAPEVEVDVELVRDNTAESTNLKAYMLASHREPEMPVLEISYVKASGGAAQAGMKSQKV